MALNIDKQRQKLDSIIAKLDALSPLKILSRGYSVTRTIPGLKIVKDYRDVTPGSRVLVNLHEGSLVCSIEKADSGEEVLEGK